MNRFTRNLILPALAFLVVSPAKAGDPWVVYQGAAGPGQGKNRSEEHTSELQSPC